MNLVLHPLTLTTFLPLVGAAILFCFTFLYLAAAGAGPWSADAAVRGKQ